MNSEKRTQILEEISATKKQIQKLEDTIKILKELQKESSVKRGSLLSNYAELEKEIIDSKDSEEYELLSTFNKSVLIQGNIGKALDHNEKQLLDARRKESTLTTELNAATNPNFVSFQEFTN